MFVEAIGSMAIFLGKSVGHGVRPPIFWKQIGKQSLDIGFFSLPLVSMTALFTGMAMALQCIMGFSDWTTESAIPTVVSMAMTREIGPILTGLMITGRFGASTAAFVGTMKVTEQIDALEMLSVNSYKYLVFPRVLAGFLLLPVLVFINDIIGIFGGYLVSVHFLGYNSANYIANTLSSITGFDIFSGLLKGAVFGFFICLFGCYQGYMAKNGADGVGVATTKSVIWSCVVIMICDCILTFLLF